MKEKFCAKKRNAVAISGDTMIVGARFDSTTASQAGAAFVYVLSGGTWTQQAVLLAGDGAVADKFGYSVAISEDTIVVGSYNDDAPLSNGGSAYVFVRSGTTWTFQQKLTASDGTADDEFGNAVGIEADAIVVGAHFADLPGNSQAGSAYVFQRSGTVWTQTQKLVPVAQVILGDHFGESIAVSRGKLAVGASGDDTPETAAGAVYVYAESGSSYINQQKITILTGTNGDRFGNSVALEGDTLVGGAREDAPFVGQTARGSAYVFEFNGATWAPQGQLLADDGAAFDRFGWSVAVSNRVVAVGAREDDTAAGPDAGSAYTFKRTGSVWTQRQKLEPTDPFNGDRFGASIAMSFNELVVGASEKALSAPNGQGAVYYYVEPPACQSIDFRAARNFAVGDTPLAVVIGDFNLDGKPDLATANVNSANISVLLGNGRGGFGPATNINGGSPNWIEVADFNLDGKPDLAATNNGGPNISVYLGDGVGNFVAAINSNVGTNPHSFIVGDFNRDGVPDLATLRNFFSDASFSVVLGNGTGSFSPPVYFPFTDPVSRMAKGDFNRDGKTDLALTDSDIDSSSLFFGNGDGSFGPRMNFTVGDYPRSIAAGDVNLDGKLDLITTNVQSQNLSLLLGNGAGSFAGASNFAGRATGDIAVSDLDLDGRPDLLTSDAIDGSIAVFRGNGLGGFASGPHFATGMDTDRIAVGDFNLDGAPDVVAVNISSDNVSVLLNACGAPPASVRFDFEGDGKADLAIFRPPSGQWWYQQSSDNIVRATTFGISTDKPVPADYDGDGKTDIAIYRPSSGEWYVLKSSNQTFYGIPFGISTDKPVPSDFDGDGFDDVAVFRGSEGVWYILKSSGGVQISQWGAAGDVPLPSDYDADGRADLVIFRPADGSWWLNRTTAGVLATAFGVSSDKPVPADFTGDGKTDIAVWRLSNGTWFVLRSEDYSFFAVPFGANGDIPVAGDYDGDGLADFAVFRPDGGNWFIQRSRDGILIQHFGSLGDIPVPSAFVP